MAAQALYRKWRSQTFDELVGQEHVVQTLRNAIREDRVAHAYLFTGPRGVGKTSMARLLAKAVNCTAQLPERPCGACASCLAITEGRAVDLVEMDAASHTSVDDAREIIERVQFRPTSGRYKIYIIDEVHMLSTAAFNALLKTLEEPPDHAMFILATTEVHKIPATILSRCQRFTFTRHTITATAAHLQRIAAQEQLTLDAGVAEAIARSSTGSMRDALGVLEQLASFTSGQITLDQVQSLLGMTSAVEVNALIEALLASDLGAALQAVNGVADQGADVRQFTRDLVERLRLLMLLVAAGDRAMIDVSGDELALLETWSRQASAALLVQWIKIFSNLDYQLRTSPYGHLPLELAVVEALVSPMPTAAPRPVAQNRPAARPNSAMRQQDASPVASTPSKSAPPLEELGVVKPDANSSVAPRIRETRPGDQDAQYTTHNPETDTTSPKSMELDLEELLPPVPEPAPAGLPPKERNAETMHAANADVSLLERIEAVWPAVVRDVRVYDPMVQALLKDMRPDMVEDKTLVLLASSAFHKDKLEQPTKKRIVEEVLSKHVGADVFIRCTTEKRTVRNDARNQIREARKDPLVKAAMNIFSATVVDIEHPEENE
ncbi:MAG: DNA polymerase III subunit gamma/tau [Chloroflexales bacterium]|nr:DNA polymerase III subunit gamma/tau [Chloroflexales bacterium]